MRVLVAREESQEVCKAFRALGHEAYSCDIQECSGGHPEWHILQDVMPILGGRCAVSTMDGAEHTIPERWDLIVAHPPCTYLAASGAVRLFRADHTIKDVARYENGKQAADFFQAFLQCDCLHVAVENPTPLKIFGLPKYDQVIEPYYFGEPWKKRTCLWLRGLKALEPTGVIEPLGLWVGSTSGRRDKTIYSHFQLHSNRSQKRRSKTFPGVARAMAEQWGGPA